MGIIFITREGCKLSRARIRCYGFARELRKYAIDTEIFSYGDDLGAKYGEKTREINKFTIIKGLDKAKLAHYTYFRY